MIDFIAEDLIDRKALLFKAKPVCYYEFENGKVVMNKAHAVLGKDIVEAENVMPTLCGFYLDDIVKFAQIMRALGIDQYDVKNFLNDCNSVYTTLQEHLMKEMQQTINAVCARMRGENNAK